MGNSRSQPCRRSRPMYLFYLIHRTWSGKTANREDTKDRDEVIDRESELSSRCSGCKTCGYRQDSLTFDSESEMAPNAEEELLAVKPWGPQPEKERLRPPTYNAEDYANALRRWGRRPIVTSQDSHGTLPSTTSSSSGYASATGEMTLRQFTSVSELLNKLRADLRLAFPSFVQEFASSPADGITLLLETLRGVQLIQSSPPSGQGGPRIGTRRAALDELGCVECLAACGERCPDAPRLLSQAQPGLLALAVCLTSSLNRSRVLALQLLTKVCQAPGGHLAVSEAVSTLRLRYGEGGRFRFLAGALLAPRAAVALRVAGISFLNAFIKSAPRAQARLYIQAEACEAGLEPRILQAWLTEVDGRVEDALTDLLHKEVQKWSQNCVDVDALQKRLARAEETCALLGNKVTVLQNQLDKFNAEKINCYNKDDRNGKSLSKNLHDREVNNVRQQQGQSSNAEDEGISSSERSSSPEDVGRNGRQCDKKIGSIENDRETTIDDVIEELRIIVKDAEEEFQDRNDRGNAKNSVNSMEQRPLTDNRATGSKISISNPANREFHNEIDPRHGPTRIIVDREPEKNSITHFGRNDDETNSVDSTITRKLISELNERVVKNSTNDSGLKIVVKTPNVEDEIVPAIIHPQPPRRSLPCMSTIIVPRDGDFLDHRVVYNPQDDDDVEEETLGDGSDSLLSASRLKYNSKNETTDCQTDRTLVHDLHSKNLNTSESHKLRAIANTRNFETTVDNAESNNEPTMKYLEVYKQFDSANKSHDCTTTIQRRGSKYMSEVEKRKMMRRSTSHDVIASRNSSPQSFRSGNRIESRIKKFESLNAFDNTNFHNFGKIDVDDKFRNDKKICRNGGTRTKMQRSESFHHVSMGHGDSRISTGGSDSGLPYATDYDLEPLVSRHNVRDARSPNFLTKSLDRIDEGRDSIVDDAVHRGKRGQTERSTTDNRGKISKSRIDDKSTANNKSAINPKTGKKFSTDKSSRNDDSYNGFNGNSKLLMSDEFYDDRRNGRRWNFSNEIDGFRKMNNSIANNNSGIVASQSRLRQDKFGYERTGGKFSNNDTGIFLPSGRYDAFGLGKNRFNAGKYSGHPQPSQRDNNIGVRRNSAASLVAKCGKVTDIISGLY